MWHHHSYNLSTWCSLWEWLPVKKCKYHFKYIYMKLHAWFDLCLFNFKQQSQLWCLWVVSFVRLFHNYMYNIIDIFEYYIDYVVVNSKVNCTSQSLKIGYYIFQIQYLTLYIHFTNELLKLFQCISVAGANWIYMKFSKIWQELAENIFQNNSCFQLNIYRFSQVYTTKHFMRASI